VIAVSVAGILLALTVCAPFKVAQSLGHVGSSWFDHEEDRPLEECRDCSESDPPIPFRRLRARP
jgi:hypothetical protein